VDDSPTETGKKRARITDSPSKRSRQSPRRSANQDQPGRAPSSTERDSSIPSTAVPSNYDPEAVDEDRIQKKPVLEPNKAFYREEPTQSPSDRNPRDTVDRTPSILSEIYDMTQIPVQDYDELAHVQTAHQIINPNRAFYIEEPSRSPSGRNSDVINANQEISQADEDESTHGLTTENPTTAEADTRSPKRRLQKKPRASNRQRVEKRRSIKEQNPSSPTKRSRRKTPRERNPSPPTQRLLRSTRSSRRDTGQELWFLGDDSVARAVGNTKRT
jgi:hypothetical protein